MNEEQLIQDIQQLRTAISTAMFLLDFKVAQLRTVCTHQSTEDYKWEHDNGYGRQTKKVSPMCSYCGKIDLWSRGHWVDRSEITD